MAFSERRVRRPSSLVLFPLTPFEAHRILDDYGLSSVCDAYERQAHGGRQLGEACRHCHGAPYRHDLKRLLALARDAMMPETLDSVA